MSGTGPLSDSLRRVDPYHPDAALSSPTLAQQPTQQQLPQAQQQTQAQQPIRVSLLQGPLKLLTAAQVKELSWQNHLKLYKVRHSLVCLVFNITFSYSYLGKN